MKNIGEIDLKKKYSFSNRPIKIIITGAEFHSPNRGVDALFIGTIACILAKYPNAKISTFGGLIGMWVHKEMLDINDNVTKIEFFGGRLRKQIMFYLISLIFRKCPVIIKRWLYSKYYSLKKFIEAHVIVDLSLGDSFSELYGFRRLWMNSLNKLIAFNLHRPIVMFPQTIGPFFSARGRFIAQQVLRRVRILCLREDISRNIVLKLMKNQPKILRSTDIAFLMKPKPVDSEQWRRRSFPDAPIVGLNISGLLFNDIKRKQLIGRNFDYIKLMKEVINLFVKEMKCFVYLAPHVYSSPPCQYDDRRACDHIYLQLPSQIQRHVALIEKDFVAPELKWIIGQFAFFVGGRMHSCINALSMKVPTLATAYSNKFKGIMDTLGVGHLACDLRETTAEEVVQKVINAFKEKDKIRQHLESIMPIIEERALKCNEFI